MDAIEHAPTATVRQLQRAASDACDGARASPGHVRSLRATARALASPHGQDILGVMDLRRRADGEHTYIRGVVDNEDFKIIFLQSDAQAELSGRMRYVMVDTTFDVVAPGAAREGVSQAGIDASAAMDYDWHHVSFVTWVYSLNRAVVVLRAMVIGKCREMYSEIFSFYFRNAMMHGLDAPVAVVVAPGRPRAKKPFVAVLLDFETAEHDGAFRAMSRTFGGSPADFHGRSIGCRVHFIGFLLKKCGNDIHHPFLRSVVALRDSPPAGGMTEVVARLSALKDTANAAGETKQATALKWLLHNRAAREAAFPLSSCTLSRTEVLAAGQTTNAIESLNRQTQLEVKQQGSPTLLGAIRALMDFDATTMLEVLPKGQAFSVARSLEGF
ncbi:hypothetical protein BU14_0345s0006 [Porphyra umbilicalis]|uniref:Uncharacterized protein n=1 Tax=Porphyra umbilicalis TaxID=2786 RepID=A0A1X6NXX3_PORUM|nr:hypothetical protein BU14_0345s0006 [Porphyra umbilicalis]|eukprot:OSX73474.1 hypothetical protein BU14_0345s0006 [Porphyra umbilicalis]